MAHNSNAAINVIKSAMSLANVSNQVKLFKKTAVVRNVAENAKNVFILVKHLAIRMILVQKHHVKLSCGFIANVN